ncbi:MAG: NAD(P)/FAD-dependent oxidoreductase [Candidatus Bathyarchaeia archaeon]
MVFDVAVVGAGPTGCMAAYTASRLGLKTALIEEHREAGQPLHCTGKLTARAFEEFNLPKDIILNSVRGAYLYSPSNVRLRVCKEDVESHIIDREALDGWLAGRACGVGVEFLTGMRCLEVTGHGGFKRLRLRGEENSLEVLTRLIIDAEGANATLLRGMGLRGAESFLVGLQYEADGVDYERDDYVELYFGSRFTPGFFGWIVPLGEHRARVGLCVSSKAAYPCRKYLDSLLREHPVVSKKLRSAKLRRLFGGRIPLHGPISKTYGDSFLVVGDAAAQTKSTSGGGVYFGLKAARIAGETAAECLNAGDYSQQQLKRYESRWRAKFGSELKFTSKVRTFLDRLSDRDLDLLFRLFGSDEKFMRIVEVYGDTAYQSRLLKPAALTAARVTLENPSKLGLLLKFAAKGLLSIIR